MTRDETAKLEKYLRGLFKMDTIKIHTRVQKADSVEVNIGDEFVGIIYKDEDEGELSYHFQMTILDFDLPDLD